MEPELITELFNYMIKYEKNCPKRVNHFLKVYSFANIIAENEKIDEKTKFLLKIVSILHDIGIKPSLEKYNSSAGKYQEIEGPSIARRALESFNVDESIIKRVCFLIAHHHQYNKIDAIDFQILVEADFLVNIFEDGLSEKEIQSIKSKYFKTSTGIELLNKLYLG